MRTVKHPFHTRYIGKPLNWNEVEHGPCDALSVQDTNTNGLATMESAWAPDMHEAVALAVGKGTIRLGVLGYAHPPVYMSVLPPEEQSNGETMNAYASAMLALVAHAERDGFILTAERVCSTSGRRTTNVNIRPVMDRSEPAARPSTPQDLQDAGYRIEYGAPEAFPDDADLHGKFWWTWSGGSGVDASVGAWAAPGEAVSDARRDLAAYRNLGISK